MTQLQSSCKRTMKSVLTNEWKAQWKAGTYSQTYRARFGGDLDKAAPALYHSLPKACAAILIQLRSGKAALASYLHRIKKAESPYCECKQGNQTVTHVIEECPLFRIQRRRVLGRPVIRSAHDILSDPTTAKKAAYFMLQTGLLDQFRVARQQIMME